MDSLPDELIQLIVTYLSHHSLATALTCDRYYHIYITTILRNLQVRKRYARVNDALSACVATGRPIVVFDRAIHFDNEKYERIFVKTFVPTNKFDSFAIHLSMSFTMCLEEIFVANRDVKYLYAMALVSKVNIDNVQVNTWVSSRLMLGYHNAIFKVGFTYRGEQYVDEFCIHYWRDDLVCEKIPVVVVNKRYRSLSYWTWAV